jgi:hypothetical protein
VEIPSKALILFALTFASAARGQSANTFDVVDLSFLIPPGENAIRIADSTKGRPILSEVIFNQFGDFINRGHRGVERPYEKLIITGFRFDPCGPIYPADWDIAKCVLPNIRLIAQVYDKGQTFTAALHMVFTLGVKVDQDRAFIQSGSGFDPSIREEVIQEIQRMKERNAAAGIATAGAPVGVHPGFSPANRDTARSRAFLAELEQLIRRMATETSYFTTAVMFSEKGAENQLAGKERWVWQKGNVQRLAAPPRIRIVPGGIPGFDPGSKEQTLTANLDSRGGVEVSPESTVENSGIANALIMSITKESSEFDWGRLQHAVDIADAMENPDRVLVQTDDCVSCHVATTARTYALKDARLGWVKRTNAFRFDAKAASLAGSLAREDTEWQSGSGYRVMSLAFFKGKPSVSQRTVNETLQAARLLNRK